MFRDKELEQLRLQKELLVLECDAQRLLLIVECQRLRLHALWLGEAAQAGRRHPWLTGVLGAGAGFAVIQALQNPRSATGWLSRVGAVAATLRSVRKFFACVL